MPTPYSTDERALVESIERQLHATNEELNGFDGAWIGDLENDGRIQIDGFVSLLQIVRAVRSADANPL